MTFRDVMKKLGMWTAVQRKTYKELSRMTDRELGDIGLTRGDVLRLVDNTTEKEG